MHSDGPGETEPRMSMRVKQKAMTRRLLRDAAVELFAAKGYGPTTIDDITSAVGVSRATFYLHFDGKARIVVEVYEQVVMPETLEFYRRLDALKGAGGEPLRQWLDTAIGFFERHRDVLRFAAEAISIDPGLEDLSASKILDRCAEAMPRYLGRWTGTDREQAQLRLELLILQLSTFCRLWVDGHWPVKRDVMLDVLLDLWTHGLRADDAGRDSLVAPSLS
ncbi:TetR/AcrR family transcriptional regulator [Pseudonocardia yunnanensis]|uniref:TetR/AcrR family transcriptional regulator n=1 Tax=Pseudonocardia yunnanensis TaxID=58107 RepID=A0ABW4EQF1_9PSEU